MAFLGPSLDQLVETQQPSRLNGHRGADPLLLLQPLATTVVSGAVVAYRSRGAISASGGVGVHGVGRPSLDLDLRLVAL